MEQSAPPDTARPPDAEARDVTAAVWPRSSPTHTGGAAVMSQTWGREREREGGRATAKEGEGEEGRERGRGRGRGREGEGGSVSCVCAQAKRKGGG